MAHKPVGTFKDVMGAPDQPWTWFSVELLLSPAWRARSVHCVRLIDCLVAEHCSHAGHENGHLSVTYGQFVRHGLGRRFISDAIVEAEALKLLKVERGGKRFQALNHMNRYTLTFYGVKTNDGRQTYYVEPTNDWRKLDAADIKRIRTELQALKRQKKERREKRKSRLTLVNSHGSPVVYSKRVTRSELEPAAPGCTTGEHPSIFGPGWERGPTAAYGRRALAGEGHLLKIER
jgi:hypothetical protein